MKLSAPIYRLKREAKLMSRAERIPLHEALDRIARTEGFGSWSLLSAKVAENKPASSVLSELKEGELVLLGARSGHGKTLLGFEIMIEAMKAGRDGRLFTLEYTDEEVHGLFGHVDEKASDYGSRFGFDNSDEISGDYIADKLAGVSAGAVVVVDYLQILDQRRETPDLAAQMQTLKDCARAKRVVIILISQIDRGYRAQTGELPGLSDVRLPNPLDLAIFDKACFLHNGEMQLEEVA
ncbi:MAG: DNA helicase [Pseudomonadales bacterium]|nr:DNA helicase [Pseudomonadales bacterium]